jgi:hypothetical protein
MKNKPQSANKGASIRSAVIKAKIQRTIRKRQFVFAEAALDYIYNWVCQCDERASKRQGGLGRNKK